MRSPLPAWLRYALQGLAYAAFAATIGYFSTSPQYRQRADNDAILKLSFSHSAQLQHACRERSNDELAKISPHMRNKLDCPRERAVVRVELDMDGKPLFQISTPPGGLHRDGAATVYRRLAIPAGAHQFKARMADGPDSIINFSKEVSLNLAPGQVLIVDFLPSSGGFVFTHG